MTQEMTKQENGVDDRVNLALIQGDLSRLSPQEKQAYYLATCKSLGLNPLTKPFEYLRLNNKEILYATKSCTEQLRSIQRVSLTILAREVVEGVYVVSARASIGDRTDESTGAVAIEGLKGEARANAMMKAETKAKRRVTLSICGLGMLDESELESIPGAQVVPHDPETGEVQSAPALDAAPDTSKYLTEMHLARIESQTTLDGMATVAAAIDADKERISKTDRAFLQSAYKQRKSQIVSASKQDTP